MLYLVGKQVYKLKLLKKWKIYNIFYRSLLEQDNTKKEQVEKVLELDTGNNSEEYKVKRIWDSAIYIKELESGDLLGLHYLVTWKDKLGEKNNKEPISAV